MDQADEELRETIRHIWPLQARKILDLLIPKSDCGFFFVLSIVEERRIIFKKKINIFTIQTFKFKCVCTKYTGKYVIMENKITIVDINYYLIYLVTTYTYTYLALYLIALQNNLQLTSDKNVMQITFDMSYFLYFKNKFLKV